MDPAYYTWIVLITIGLIYGLLAKKKLPASKKSSSHGHLVVLGLMVVGLIISSSLGYTNLAFFLGVMLMVLIPVLVLTSIGAGIGSAVKTKVTKNENSE